MFDPRPLYCNSLTTAVGGTKDTNIVDSESPYRGTNQAARQKSVKNLFKGGAIKETMGQLISKFFIYDSVVPHKADSHYFKKMIVGAQQAGM